MTSAQRWKYLAVVECVNLLENPGPGVSRHLLDDLDGVLHLGVDVDAGLNAGVGALAQHFASQSVQLLSTKKINIQDTKDLISFFFILRFRYAICNFGISFLQRSAKTWLLNTVTKQSLWTLASLRAYWDKSCGLWPRMTGQNYKLKHKLSLIFPFL